MIGHISANQRFKYTKHKNHYLIQKQYPLYIILVSARLIKYIVKTKHIRKKAPYVWYYVGAKIRFQHAREECESKRAYVFQVPDV